MSGRPPGYPKSGGAKKGSIKTNTQAVKDTIKQVFYDDLGGANYLRKVAQKDPSLFCSLLAKLIPQEVRQEISVNHSLDLGAAMAEANARLALSHDNAPLVIDVSPIGDRDARSFEEIDRQPVGPVATTLCQKELD